MLGRGDLAKAARPERPPFPFEVEYLWNWFNEFSFGLKADGMGPVTASWSDVIAWCVAADVDCEPWERKALVRLAHARAMVLSEKQAQTIKAASGNQTPA